MVEDLAKHVREFGHLLKFLLIDLIENHGLLYLLFTLDYMRLL